MSLLKMVKHTTSTWFFLNDDTTYVVEDIGGADVSRSAYEIHFLSEVLESGMLDIKVDK